MSLSSRVARLERAAQGPARCPRCGGPDPNGKMIAIVTSKTPLGSCPGCDMPLDSEGRPLGAWHDGQLHFKVIYLED